MGLKKGGRRKCDRCGKPKRYDNDKWLQEGWSRGAEGKICPQCTSPARPKKPVSNIELRKAARVTWPQEPKKEQ